MKKWTFIVFIALTLIGCGALISVGDNNTNSQTNEFYKKDKR